MEKKTRIIAFAVIALVIILGLFSYMNFNRYFNQNVQNDDINKQNDGYEINRTEPGELSFINERFNYGVTFPKDWIAYDLNDLSLISFYNGQAQNQIDGSESMPGIKIEISVKIKDPNATLNSLVEQEQSILGEDSIIYKKDVLVDNTQAIEMASDVQGYSVVTYFNAGQYLYWVAAYMDDGTEIEKNVETYHSIIASVKFIN